MTTVSAEGGMQSGVSRRIAELFSGLAWAVQVLGVVLLAAGLLELAFDHFGVAPLGEVVLGMLLLIGARVAIATHRSRGSNRRPSRTYGEVRIGALQSLAVTGWVVCMIGVLVIALGALVFALGQVAAGLAVTGVGVLLLLCGAL